MGGSGPRWLDSGGRRPCSEETLRFRDALSPVLHDRHGPGDPDRHQRSRAARSENRPDWVVEAAGLLRSLRELRRTRESNPRPGFLDNPRRCTTYAAIRCETSRFRHPAESPGVRWRPLESPPVLEK